MSTIVVDGTAAFPGTLAIQSFYYGHDYSRLINLAFIAKPASALVILDGCGTIQALDVMVDPSANNANPSLVGSNSRPSGLYAFAAPLENRGTLENYVLSSVLYAGIVSFKA